MSELEDFAKYHLEHKSLVVKLRCEIIDLHKEVERLKKMRVHVEEGGVLTRPVHCHDVHLRFLDHYNRVAVKLMDSQEALRQIFNMEVTLANAVYAYWEDSFLERHP